MNTEDLNEIVELHGKWLRSEAGGERASLWGANLCDANLRGSNLWGANLWGANLWGCTGNSKQIKSLFVSEVYQVTYTDKYLQIGCQRHEIAEWWEFNNAAIEKMDGQKALDFWTEWRDLIKTIIEKSPALPSGVEI